MYPTGMVLAGKQQATQAGETFPALNPATETAIGEADYLAVTGLTTGECVRAAVVDGADDNYPLYVLEEAAGDRNTDATAANLPDRPARYDNLLRKMPN